MTTKLQNLLSIAALCALSACAGGPAPLAEAEPYQPPQRAEDQPIGYYLSRLNGAISAWNRTKLEARTEEDSRELRALQRAIKHMARLRLGDLVAELEAGPPANRTIAAVALGFSDLEEAQSPLLSALEDPDPLVVSSALLGLGILERADTPLAQICHLMRRDLDNYTRNNAAFAMQRILIAGGDDPCALLSARDALLDPESAVRAKGALILYLLEDTESLIAIGDLLYDDEAVVTAAAATALAGLGVKTGFTGEAARQLVAALDRVHPTRRVRILHELHRLHGSDLGEEAEPWRDWAYRLP